MKVDTHKEEIKKQIDALEKLKEEKIQQAKEVEKVIVP